MTPLLAALVHRILTGRGGRSVLSRRIQGLARRIRSILIRLGDPLVESDIDGTVLRLPLSHLLPHFRRNFPLYSQNVGRVAGTLAGRVPGFAMVDIGANVGDTVAIVRAHTDAPMLCIEGDDRYFRILAENTRDDAGVVRARAFLGEDTQEARLTVVSDHGTAKLSRGDDGGVVVVSLPQVLQRHPTFLRSTLVKVDTDGFDLAILRGAREWLANQTPVLFVEFDPHHLAAAGESPAEMLDLLRGLDYDGALIYENTGDLVCALRLEHGLELDTLAEGFAGWRGNRYLDFCLFHRTDEHLFQAVLQEERSYYRRHRSYASIKTGPAATAPFVMTPLSAEEARMAG